MRRKTDNGHRQRATVKGDKIEVSSYFCRKKIWHYKISLAAWEKVESMPGNKAYNKTKFIESVLPSPELDAYISWSRIVKYQVKAIDEAMLRYRLSVKK